MPDTLHPAHALGGAEPQEHAVGPCTLRERPDLALALLAVRCDADAAPLAAWLGEPLPGPGRWTGTAERGAIWAGRGRWLIGTPHRHGLAAELQALAPGFRAVEQSDAFVRLDLDGEGWEAATDLLCALDLRRATPGFGARTAVERTGCYVLLRRGGVAFLVPRASAASVHHAILAAMVAAL
ncbi:sarcosine oxidase subunit gamma [Jannaschia sp. W003]|uniref:sarcosine oxidase subunit gamma n=1 Tax=Jannaschia sp. W003 TaxID=2867012 RepID=UPI0021A81ABC|nr:hypothetical protein [Jannaschia sp. W003]UWQ21497.1 hypothetical protein K3554_00220 [Jannaschia sp. W003]